MQMVVGNKKVNMNNKNIELGNGIEEESKMNENNDDVGTEVHRLTISKVAELALISVMERVNNGFAVGKVNRNNLANWIIAKFAETVSQDQIKEIRTAYTDEFAALDMVLRRAKESGKLPPELKAYLLKHIGDDEAPKKKKKNHLQNNVINDDI